MNFRGYNLAHNSQEHLNSFILAITNVSFCPESLPADFSEKITDILICLKLGYS